MPSLHASSNNVTVRKVAELCQVYLRTGDFDCSLLVAGVDESGVYIYNVRKYKLQEHDAKAAGSGHRYTNMDFWEEGMSRDSVQIGLRKQMKIAIKNDDHCGGKIEWCTIIAEGYESSEDGPGPSHVTTSENKRLRSGSLSYKVEEIDNDDEEEKNDEKEESSVEDENDDENNSGSDTNIYRSDDDDS